MTTTARVDMAAGLKTILNQAVSQGLIQQAFAARPGSLAFPTPFGFVDVGDERVTHDAGTRVRVLAPSLVVVDRWTENDEAAARMNAVVDGLLDLITANAHISSSAAHSGGLTITVAPEQVPLPDGSDATFLAARFAYLDVNVQEGRD